MPIMLVIFMPLPRVFLLLLLFFSSCVLSTILQVIAKENLRKQDVDHTRTERNGEFASASCRSPCGGVFPGAGCCISIAVFCKQTTFRFTAYTSCLSTVYAVKDLHCLSFRIIFRFPKPVPFAVREPGGVIICNSITLSHPAPIAVLQKINHPYVVSLNFGFQTADKLYMVSCSSLPFLLPIVLFFFASLLILCFF